MNPSQQQAIFQRSYPLSPGLYLWLPLISGVFTVVAVSVMMPLMILIFPFVLVLSLLPACILGGRLLVHAGPGYIRLTRQRFTWHIVRELSFPPSEVPRVEATRTVGHKPFGWLRVTASTGSKQVDGALVDSLAPIAADLQAYFGRR